MLEKAKGGMLEKESNTLAVNDDVNLSNEQSVVKSYVDAIMDRTKLLLYVTMGHR